MARRKPWTWKCGPHGARVVLRERSYGSNVQVGAFDRTIGGRRWRSLKFKVRDVDGQLIPDAVSRAKEAALDLSTHLIRGESDRNEEVTLGELIALFKRDRVPAMRGRHRLETDRELELLRRVLGSQIRVQEIGSREWDVIRHLRASGTIDGRGQRLSPDERTPTAERTVAKTLKALRQLCRFGTTYRRNGRPLLAFDPTAGLQLPVNPDPGGPVCTDDEYGRLLAASQGHQMRVGNRKMVPSYLSTLLVLCAETGRRIGAVVALRWEDWLPNEGSHGMLRWRADSDKLRRRAVTPVTPEVREALERLRRTHPNFHDWMFPAPNSNGHISVALVSRWFRGCEKLAGLEHEPGFGYHSLRRAFATKRKALPVQDVAALGGWKGTQVLMNLYQRADVDAMEKVLLEGQKVELRVVR
jgi:integrase